MNKTFEVPCCFCDSTYMYGRNFDISSCPACYNANGRFKGVKDIIYCSKNNNLYYYKDEKLFILEYNDGKKYHFTRPKYDWKKIRISKKKFNRLISSDTILSEEYRKFKLKAFW